MVPSQRLILPIATLAVFLTASAGLNAQSPALEKKFKELPDIVFAEASGQKLMLNLYLPLNATKPPLVMHIHGGGWQGGSRNDKFATYLTEHGYAVASIDYRFSSTAKFPAQIMDCKGAVRWLRAHAEEHGYDASRMAAMGTSAGGHLSVLLGTSGEEKELEGDIGGNLNQSSRVQAIVDFFGPVDFVLRSTDQADQTDKETGRTYKLLGGPVLQNIELAKQASGAFHVTKDDPPLIIFHGTKDRTVHMNQAHRIRDAYTEEGLQVEFHSVEGAGHGGAMFSAPECRELVLKFLSANLKK